MPERRRTQGAGHLAVNATDILRLLPASLEWMVFFRLSAVRPWAHDTQMKAMFFLPEQLGLDPFTHVVLSSHGRFLVPQEGPNLYLVENGQAQATSHDGTSLLHRYYQLLEALPAEEPDCLGLGKKPNLPPVILHVTIRDGDGHAHAIFHRKPSGADFELLKAVGVEYQGGYSAGSDFVASFRNRLPVHLHSGSLAGYSRTGNCNLFFLNHGEIDRNLAAGLIQASDNRTAWGRETGLAATARLGLLARHACLAMTCQPPPPENHFEYGDLVPLGFLLKALNHSSKDSLAEPTAQVREILLAARQRELWSFHSGRLVTATDSALILQAFPDRAGVAALERFSDGEGQYYPQLWSQTKQPDRMVISDCNAHWCQPDFATTCLVRSLRADVGLPRVTPLHYLEDHFETRSGLYFANPYLTDWAFANAIRNDTDAAKLKQRLMREILGGMNDDHSFGAYDRALSTSFAILALAALGCQGRLLRLAQLQLLNMMDQTAGTWPECTPFYSTFLTSEHSENRASSAADGFALRSQILNVGGSLHELSLYIDTHRMIATAVAVLALGERCDPAVRDLESRDAVELHPRYTCRSHAEYIRDFALPPYVEVSQARSCIA
jgi:hypothetical protein